MIPNVCTIAGSDPSGGAGIQADHKTFAAHGVYGCSVLTACTAQNTHGVFGVHPIPAAFVAEQLQVLVRDVRLHSVKTGMLASAEIIAAVADTLRQVDVGPIVVDPVMVATSGHRLLEAAAEEALKRQLLPLATMLTPNLPEAAVLLGCSVATTVQEMEEMLGGLRDLGARSIYLKGGHLPTEQGMTDLFWDGHDVHALRAPRLATRHTHGTGCSLAASLAARLARGQTPLAAAQGAHAWLHQAIAQADQLEVGSGNGPVNHFVPTDF